MTEEKVFMSKYKNYFEKLKGEYHYARLGKPFQTRKKKYFYDTGTGKVLECTDTVFDILKTLFKEDSFDAVLKMPISQTDMAQALDEIRDCIEKEHILQAVPVKEFNCAHLHALETYIDQALMQVILEVTEKCNLRCAYCIYGSSNDDFRNFGQKDMSFDIAKKAIDYGVAHSPEKLTVSFYGGEPLLRYDFIKECIAYCQKTYPGKELQYSMTTNLTLMTKERAEFFASIPNFVITGSIDGPEEIHDANRKFPNGDGSFAKAMEGLRNIAEALGDQIHDRLKFSMVAAPPNTKEKFDAIQAFFDSLEWLPHDIAKISTYAQYSGKTDEKVIDLRENMEAEEIDPRGVWTKEKISDFSDIEKSPVFMQQSVQDSLIRIHKRRLFDLPVQNYPFNGCCIPASRRIYVTVDGQINICEKMGLSPDIGDVDNGVDMSKIKKHYIDDYMRESVKYCNDCWAVNLCSICYAECYDEKGFLMEGKMTACNTQRYYRENAMILYHEYLEHNPEALEYLNGIKIE